MHCRFLLIGFVCAAWALAQANYTGPKPPKQDVPYLLHADTLVETESLMAQEQTAKDGINYVVHGDISPARTPLASPVLIMDASKLDASRLQLYKLDAKNGNREILFKKKGRGNPIPLQLTVTHLTGNLWKIEAVDSLPNGEYALTLEGSNQVFCFQIY